MNARRCPAQIEPENLTHSTNRYVAYVTLTIAATIVVKLALTPYIPYSQALTDDYDYMYKTLCFLKGDWTLTSYNFKKTYTGPAYPLAISPWVLFEHPRAKMLCIYSIHFLLSAGVIGLGSALVARLSRRRSLLAPIVLATYAPTFLFNYYAMTENLFFFLLILTLWLCVDFESTCRRWPRLFLLLGLCVVLPLIRTPGYAIVPALWAMIVVNRRALGVRRSIGLGAAFLICAILPEQYFYHVMYGAERIGSYASGLSRHFENSAESSVLRPIKFLVLSFAAQIGYVFLTTGVWLLPALLIVAARLRKGATPADHTRWRNLLVFSATIAFVLLAFTEVHISSRAQMNPDKANFVIGRYGDPAAVIVAVAGLCALLSIRSIKYCSWALLIPVVPAALYFTLSAFDNRVYHPMHDIGLSILALARLRTYPAHYFWIPIAAVAIVGAVSRWWRVALPLMLSLIILFNVMTLRNGFTYTSRWSLRVAGTLEGAEWTVDNVAKDARILCDRSVRWRSPPPGLAGWKWRSVYNVYLAYVLLVHPISVNYVDLPSDASTADAADLFGDADYLLSVLDASPAADWGYPVAWHNEHYVIYRLDESQRKRVWPLHITNFDVSREKMRGTDRITMAWHNCRAELREPLALDGGQYELVMRATGEGCPSSPPQLIVELPGLVRLTLDIEPGATRQYRIPFEVETNGLVGIVLIENERPRCPDQIDKNVFIESMRIELSKPVHNKDDAG